MKNRYRAITLEQHLRILKGTERRDFKHFLEMLWETGGRPHDILHLQAENIDWRERQIVCICQKTKSVTQDPVRIPINEGLEKILKELPATGPLFGDMQGSGVRAITRTFWILCHYVGLPPILSLHSYRLRKLHMWGLL